MHVSSACRGNGSSMSACRSASSGHHSSSRLPNPKVAVSKDTSPSSGGRWKLASGRLPMRAASLTGLRWKTAVRKKTVHFSYVSHCFSFFSPPLTPSSFPLSLLSFFLGGGRKRLPFFSVNTLSFAKQLFWNLNVRRRPLGILMKRSVRLGSDLRFSSP